METYDSITTTPTQAFLTDVQNMAVYGTTTPANGAKPVVQGLLLSNVAVTPTGGLAGTLTAPTQITVAITGYTVDAVFGTWNLNGKPNATFPYVGILTPPLRFSCIYLTDPNALARGATSCWNPP